MLPEFSFPTVTCGMVRLLLCRDQYFGNLYFRAGRSGPALRTQLCFLGYRSAIRESFCFRRNAIGPWYRLTMSESCPVIEEVFIERKCACPTTDTKVSPIPSSNCFNASLLA